MKYCKLIYLFYENMRNKIKDIVIYLQQQIFLQENKNSEDCSIALQNIIKINGSPKVLMNDNDKAYVGKEFNKILNKYDIVLN